MRNRLPAALLAMLVALAFGGCSCGDDTDLGARPPEANLSVGTLSFGEVCNESQHHQTFVVRNTGGSALNAELAVVGAGAAYFDVNPKTISVPAAGQIDVSVTYLPTDDAAGGESQIGERHLAQLELKYTGKDSAQITEVLDLDGEVSDKPVAPLASFACGTKPDGSAIPHCKGGDEEPCCSVTENGDGTTTWNLLGFGQPRAGNTVSLPLRVQNLGCGDLTVESLTLNPQIAECAEGSAKIVGGDTPFTVPGGLGANQGHDFALEFTPDRTCTFVGTLQFTTNDPNRANYTATVQGNGREARLVTSAQLLQFGEVPPGTVVEQEFVIRNNGQIPVTVTRIAIVNAVEGREMDYEILKLEKDACLVNGNPAGAREAVTVGSGYTFEGTNSFPNCGDDEMFVTIRYTPTTPANSDSAAVEIESSDGLLKVQLRGGTYPILVTNPEEVNFAQPAMVCTGSGSGLDLYSCDRLGNGCAGVCLTDTDCPGGETCYGANGPVPGTCSGSAACALSCGTASKTVEVCNEGIAPLNVSDIFVTGATGGPSPKDPINGHELFTVAAETCTSGAVATDACCTVTVDFRDTNMGGTSAATLNIQSDDPAYADQGGIYSTTITARTKPDALPQARFTYQTGAEAGDWVMLDAQTSTDSEGVARGLPNNGITSYTWYLRQAPSDAGDLPTGMIDPNDPNAGCTRADGQCFRFPFGPENTRVIEFKAELAGGRGYTWRLVVTDDGCNPAHEGEFVDTVNIANVGQGT